MYVVGVEALKLKTMTRGRVGHFILNRERSLSLCLSASLSQGGEFNSSKICFN